MLHPRFARGAVALTAVLGLLLGSCAGNQKNADEATTEQRIDADDEAEAREDAKVLIEQASAWLPSDAVVVGGFTAERYRDLASTFFPRDRVGLEGEQPGTPEGMRADLGQLMLDRMGVDLTQLEGVAFGANQDAGAFVLFGDIPLDATKIDSEKIDGTTVMSITPAEHTDVTSEAQTLWMTAFDKPRVGLAVFMKREHLVDALAAREEDNDSEPPAQLSTPMFEDLPSGGIVVVGHLDERIKRQMPGMPFPPPDRLGVSFGDTLTMHLEGSTQSLDGVSQIVEQYQSRARSQLQQIYQRSNDADVGRATASIVAYHYGLAYLESLEESRAEGRLTYSISMPDAQTGLVAPGIIAAIAVPAFLKYIKRSKSAEAQHVTRQLANGAKAYFVSEQRGCKGRVNECEEPWHASTRAGFPVSFDKYTFPGGPNYRLVTHAEAPSDGTKSSPSPSTTQGDPSAATVLDALRVSFNEPTYFRYVYETGPGTGVDATAKIYAEADFDGHGEPNHRMEIQLEVDPSSQAVRVAPAYILNEFQ